ncbi:MAG: M23 family metallopeptidase [Deltaproteobacteria bacterium]|nr:M23 family metallopeptidase [Deltaproteobacteria bacterium]
MSNKIVIQVEDEGRTQRQFVLGGGKLKAGLVLGATFAFLLLAAASFATWEFSQRVGNGPTAQAENAVLRGRLQAIEARVSRVDQALERVMAQDAKIRTLSAEDASARAYGLEPLTELELAAAERQGLNDIAPVQGSDLGPIASEGITGSLEALEARTRELEGSLIDEEASLYEVRTYLDDRSSLVNSHPSVWPVRGWLTSRYGYRNSPHGEGRRLHAGIDIAAPRGTPVVAPSDGHVVFAGYHTAYGNLVIIDHGYGLSSKYAHLSRLHVRVGQRIAAGNLLGRVGSTGRSTGPHLHFEIHQDGVAVNPLRFLETD